MVEPSDFPQQLRSLREAQGLSVRALATRLGVSKVTVWKWEKGENKPRARMVSPIAKALDVEPIDLMLSKTISEGEHEAETLPSPAPEAAGQGEGLPEVIARAKRMIAEASGVGPRNITISIEY